MVVECFRTLYSLSNIQRIQALIIQLRVPKHMPQAILLVSFFGTNFFFARAHSGVPGDVVEHRSSHTVPLLFSVPESISCEFRVSSSVKTCKC
jgi:hypothetical protein